MRGIVDLRQVLEVEMGVDLRRSDARVSQHLLHGAQVAGRLQHVRRERVPQHVRMHVPRQSLLDRAMAHARLDCSRREPRPALRHEDGVVAANPELRARIDPPAQRAERFAADRHDPLLRALPPDADFARVPVDAIQRQSGELREAQARRVEELEHRAVAHCQRVVGVCARQRDEKRRLVGRECVRQFLRRLRRPQSRAGVGRDAALLGEIAVERAPRRQHPTERASREPASVQHREEATELRPRDRLDRDGRLRFRGERGELLGIAQVCGAGVRRGAGREMRGEIGDDRRGSGRHRRQSEGR
jgi:hypothetical protein